MLSNIPLYDYTSFSPTTGPMSYFQFGGIMNKVAMTIHIQVLYGLMISFLCKILFQSGSTNLHSHQKCMQIPVAPNSWQLLLLSVYLILAILVDV